MTVYVLTRMGEIEGVFERESTAVGAAELRIEVSGNRWTEAAREEPSCRCWMRGTDFLEVVEWKVQ